MERGRKLLSSALSFALALSLIAPGSAAYAESDAQPADEPLVVADGAQEVTEPAAEDVAVVDEAATVEDVAPEAEPAMEESAPTEQEATEPAATDEAATDESAPAEQAEPAPAAPEATATEPAADANQPAAEYDDEALAAQALEPENDGDIALRAQAAQGWSRIWGQNCFDTMQKILRTEGVFASNRGGDVVIASSDGYWDALSATGFAGTVDAPILITPTYNLNQRTREELQRLNPERVWVAGGTMSVSLNVTNAIRELLPNVKIERLAGADAAETSLALYEQGEGWSDTCIVATSNGYWDALSIAPYAYSRKCPVFLTTWSRESASRTLTSAQVRAIKNGGFKKVVVVGGTLSVAELGPLFAGSGIDVERVWGHDCFDTSAEIAKWELQHGMTLDHLSVASSNGYWDALSAAALNGKLNSVLVLVSKTGDYRALDAVYDYGSQSVQHGHIYGGPLSIPKVAEKRITAFWTITSFKASKTSMKKGSTVKVTATVSGAPEGTTYAFKWVRNQSGDSGDIAGSATSLTRNVWLNSTGLHTIYVTATSPSGYKSQASVKVYVYDAVGLSLHKNGDGSYTATANIGTDPAMVPTMRYRYTWKGDNGKSGTLCDWTPNPSITFPSSSFGTASKITVTVSMRESGGNVGSASKTINIDPMTARAQGYSSPTSWLIMVDETKCWVGWYRGYQGNWELVKKSRCSCGAGGATPHGIFSIGARGYSFGNGYSCYWWVDYWQAAWAFHSIKYDEGTFNVQDGRLGYHISAGCIRLPLDVAKYNYDYVPYDTTVVIY